MSLGDQEWLLRDQFSKPVYAWRVNCKAFPHSDPTDSTIFMHICMEMSFSEVQLERSSECILLEYFGHYVRNIPKV